MSDFEELDYRATPLGELSLRRRRVLSLEGREVFEVKLGDEFLMSSLFNEGEIALANLGLAGHDAAELDVVVRASRDRRSAKSGDGARWLRAAARPPG